MLNTDVKKYKKSRKSRLTKSQKIVFTLVIIFFFLYAATVIYPFIWAFFNSMKGKEEFLRDPLSLPSKFDLSNFINAFTNFEVFGVNLIGMFGNSIVLTVCATLLSVVSCTCTAYCVVKYKFIGRKFLYFLAIMIMLVPTIGSMPAMYRLVTNLSLKDNVVGVSLLWGSGFGFNFLLLYSFFKNVSGAYAEAAKVDGAGDYTIFFRIMLPQALPAMVAAAIVTAIGVWNDYLTPFLYLENSPTIAYGLYDFEMNINSTMDYPTLFAGIILSCLPLIIIFIIFQKTIITNTVAGGLKG